MYILIKPELYIQFTKYLVCSFYKDSVVKKMAKVVAILEFMFSGGMRVGHQEGERPKLQETEEQVIFR